MSLLALQRFLSRPFDEANMTKTLEQRFKLRNIKDIVRQLENFRYAMLEAQRIGDKQKAERYSNCVFALEWVLNVDNKKDN